VGDLGLVYPSVGVARVLGGGSVCTAKREAMARWEEEIEEEKKTTKSWKGSRCVSMCVDKMRIKKGHCNAPSVAKKDKKRGEGFAGDQNKREREREQKRITCNGAWNVSPALFRSGPN
jgi:hypothetical protein